MARVEGPAQKIQSKPVRKQVQNVGSVRSRPLAGKSFFLDLPSGKTLEFLEKSVKRLGGVVESFLSKEVSCIVSNDQDAGKRSWGRKQTAAALRNAQAGSQTSVGLGKGHRDPSYKPADAVLITRGKALLQKAIGTQSNTGGGNSVLASAQSWGIQIMHTDDMFSYLQWLDSKRCHSARQMKPFPSRPQSALKGLFLGRNGVPDGFRVGHTHYSQNLCMRGYRGKAWRATPPVTRLQSPFLKVEDESRRLRPFLQQFKTFPELCFPERRRHSPFGPLQSPASSKTPEGRPAHSGGSSDCCLVPKRQRGYCECCEETFVELQTHLQSPWHTAFARDISRYAPVDSLISQMANVFAASSCPPPPLRVLPATSGDYSGFQEDILPGIMASSGQPQKSRLSGKSSDGRPVSRGSSTLWPENPLSLWRWTELLGETPSTPGLPPLQSLQSGSGRTGGGSSGAEHHGRGGTAADAPLKLAASPGVGAWDASQQKVWAPPVLLPPQPRKRKLSYSPRGQVKKRPTPSGQLLSQPSPDTNALPGAPPAGTTEGSFSQECGRQTGPGCLQLSAAPVAEAQQSPLRAPPTQLPPEGSARPPQEQAAPETGGLQQPGQQLERKEESAAHPREERHTQTPGTSPRVDASLGTASFPTGGTGASSQLPGSVVQPCSPETGPSPFTGAVGPEWSGLGPAPLSCSSSESDWDQPLLCALEGPPRPPLEPPVDSALLGTCVSLRDSGYESHLCSVLWQTLEPHEAPQGDSGGCHGEVLWAPFSSLGTTLLS